MSKYVIGEVKLSNLAVVREAAALLKWPCAEQQQAAGTVRVAVQEPGAHFRPWIDVAMIEGKGRLTYDHLMGLGCLGADDLDDVTRRAVGRFKQAIAQVETERLLVYHRAAWRITRREDEALVLEVQR